MGNRDTALIKSLMVKAKNNGISQKDIAIAAKMKPSAFSEYLNGKREIQTDTFDRLLKAFNVKGLKPTYK